MKYRILESSNGKFIPQCKYLFKWTGFITVTGYGLHGPEGPDIVFDRLKDAEDFIKDEMEIDERIKSRKPITYKTVREWET